MEKLIRISVRELVEFILRRGDIETGLLATVDRAQEGARIHRMIQKITEKMIRLRFMLSI